METKELQIVKIDPKEYGVPENIATQIAEQFKPMLDKMIELEDEFNEIMNLEPSKESCAMAKVLLHKYVKIRTGTDEIHEKQKAFYLAGGRYVDGWKNAQRFASQGKEEKLKEKSKHFETLELERLHKIQVERESQLIPYDVDGSMMALMAMTEEVWKNYLLGVKLSFEKRKEEEKLAEEKRIAEIEAERKRIEEQRIENEKLKAEADKREAEIAAERIKQQKILEAQKAEADKKLKAEQEKARKETERIAEEQRKEKAKQDIIIAEQKREQEKLQKELQDKKDAEEKAKIDAENKLQAELNKGDAEKFQNLLSDLTAIKTKYSFKGKKYITLQNSVNELIDKIVTYAKK